MITLHHLGVSQSERVLWLLEELNLEYKLVKHERAPLLSPDSLKAVPGNETGRSPFIEDSDANITLGESGAICEYLVHRYGNGRLSLSPSDSRYPDYLYWFHYANATIQPNMLVSMFIDNAQVAHDNASWQFAESRLQATLKHLNERLQNHKWLAGDEFTLADIMSVYPLTTQRYFGPQRSLGDNTHVLRWLKDCAGRPAYMRAMEKGDPDMKLLVEAAPPEIGMGAAGGIASSHWKK